MAVREATAAEIPRVDVSGLRSHTLSGTPTADDIAAQIRAASLGTGFFFITGHGLEDLLASLLAAATAYFATPEAERAVAADDRFARGFRDLRKNEGEAGLDHKESFDIGADLPLTHP